VSRVHSSVSVVAVLAHVPLLVQAYVVTVRDVLPVSLHRSLPKRQLPQLP
jgi:hypothetical protein